MKRETCGRSRWTNYNDPQFIVHWYCELPAGHAGPCRPAFLYEGRAQPLVKLLPFKRER